MTRLGRIGYVNCYPVYWAIDRGLVAAPASLVTGTPAELNDRLADGRLDVSVISAVAYAQHAGDLELLPDLAISSDGPVRSVLLFSRLPPEARAQRSAATARTIFHNISVPAARLLTEMRSSLPWPRLSVSSRTKSGTP